MFLKTIIQNNNEIDFALLNELFDLFIKIENENSLLKEESVILFLINRIPGLSPDLFEINKELFLKLSNFLYKTFCFYLNTENNSQTLEAIINLYFDYNICFEDNDWVLIIGKLTNVKNRSLLHKFLRISEQKMIFNQKLSVRAQLWNSIFSLQWNSQSFVSLILIFKEISFVSADEEATKLIEWLSFWMHILQQFILKLNSCSDATLADQNVFARTLSTSYIAIHVHLTRSIPDVAVDSATPITSEAFGIYHGILPFVQNMIKCIKNDSFRSCIKKSKVFTEKIWLIDLLSTYGIKLVDSLSTINPKEAIYFFSFFMDQPHTKTSWLKTEIILDFLIKNYSEPNLLFLFSLISNLEFDISIPKLMDSELEKNEGFKVFIGALIIKKWDVNLINDAFKIFVGITKKLQITQQNNVIIEICNDLITFILSNENFLFNNFESIYDYLQILVYIEANKARALDFQIIILNKLLPILKTEYLQKNNKIEGAISSLNLAKRNASMSLSCNISDRGLPHSSIIQLYRIRSILLQNTPLPFSFYQDYFAELFSSFIFQDEHKNANANLISYFLFFRNKLNEMHLENSRNEDIDLRNQIKNWETIEHEIDGKLLIDFANRNYQVFETVYALDLKIDELQKKISLEHVDASRAFAECNTFIFAFNKNGFSSPELTHQDIFCSFLLLHLSDSIWEALKGEKKTKYSYLILAKFFKKINVHFHNFSNEKKKWYLHLLGELIYFAIDKGNLQKLKPSLLSLLKVIIFCDFFKEDSLLAMQFLYFLTPCPNFKFEDLKNLLDGIQGGSKYKKAIESKFHFLHKTNTTDIITYEEKLIFQFFEEKVYSW